MIFKNCFFPRKELKEFKGIFHKNKGNKGIFKVFTKIKEFKGNSFKIKELHDA